MKQSLATIIVLTLLGALAAARIVDTYDEFNATFDEGYQVAAGLQAYQQGRFDAGAEQPPLVRWALALLPHLAGIEYRSTGPWAAQPSDHIPLMAQTVFEQQGDYWHTLKLARMGNLLFLPFLLLYTHRWAAALYGRYCGWAACAIVTLSPNILASAALATVDFGFTVCLLAASYYLWRWLAEPDPRRSLMLGLALGFAIGLAVAAKYSAILFLPAVLLGLLAARQGGSLWRPRSWRTGQIRIAKMRQAARSLVPAALLALLTIWGAYAFEMRPLRDPARRPYDTVESRLPESSSLKTAVYWAIESVPLPLQDMVTGIEYVREHAAGGHPAFLLREVRQHGWWHYFLVVLGVKTSLPFLALIALAGLLVFRRGGIDGDALGPLAAALGILLAVMPSPLNVGVRHILPIYALLAIWASSCVAEAGRRRSKAWGAAVLLLLCWHGVESLRAHPDYLPYFNQIARGREHKVLGDSNLDWGQDLHRLARYVEENGIEDLALNYFGTTSPEAVGLEDSRRFGPGDRPRGWVALSVTNLQGIYQPRPAWLDAHEPRARVGKSIYLYFIE
ncbi:MAG: glycosyltransferase family 39 protein [Acidobacteria bacterium]|nr:glycosyltransferase family 39 protein [Acidobacteriota bacterium]